MQTSLGAVRQRRWLSEPSPTGACFCENFILYPPILTDTFHARTLSTLQLADLLHSLEVGSELTLSFRNFGDRLNDLLFFLGLSCEILPNRTHAVSKLPMVVFELLYFVDGYAHKLLCAMLQHRK